MYLLRCQKASDRGTAVPYITKVVFGGIDRTAMICRRLVVHTQGSSIGGWMKEGKTVQEERKNTDFKVRQKPEPTPVPRSPWTSSPNTMFFINAVPSVPEQFLPLFA